MGQGLCHFGSGSRPVQKSAIPLEIQAFEIPPLSPCRI
jgi:hypothetical protein